MLVRDDASTNDNDQLGGIGFDSRDGTESSTLKSLQSIIAFAAERS